MKKIYLIIFILTSYLLPQSTLAARIFFNPPSSYLNIEDSFEVNIFIDTENEDINALEGKLTFPSHLLDLEKIYEKNSIISFWIEKPHLKNSSIIFSGIIPGGYLGEKGSLFSLIFKTKKEGSDFLKIDSIKSLIHDGAGTETKTKKSEFSFSISKDIDQTSKVSLDDQTPPEPFTPIISKNDKIFDGKYFLVFSTKDKDSGIDRYEIKEGQKGTFTIAKSPYLLKNQKLDKKIYLQAIDKASNERIVIIPPSNIPLYQKIIVLGIIIIVVIFITFKKVFN